MIRFTTCGLAGAALFLWLGLSAAFAGVDRIVIIKADGLAFDSVDHFVRQKDPYTGKSVLPWIDYVFYQRGARVSNFYSRGLSLSAGSWALLDTGQPSVIKGNLEFDRLTLQPYDYLNAFTYVLKNSAGRKTATPGVRVLDELGIPLLSDAYDPSERSLSLQLFARGLPLAVGTLKRFLTLQSPKEWFDEWTIGFESESLFFEVLERNLIAKLKDPKVRYLDLMIPVFDHTSHVNREPEALRHALQKIDRTVGDIWRAIEKSPLPRTTALVLVSDHGMNTSPDVYSQGYNLIDFFGSATGGGHHIVTNRPPLGAYALKPPSPLLPPVTTPSADSYYLKGQAASYPTLLLDADGNERASVYLRNSDLNVLQILLQQLTRYDLAEELKTAATTAFFDVIERRRPEWALLLSNLEEELAALRRTSGSQTDFSKYSAYVDTLHTLLRLKRDDFDPSAFDIDRVLAKDSVGALNSVHDLQNYVVGVSREGLVLDKDGSLDFARSFARVDYFSALLELRARNNVQAGVDSRPIDFIATPVATEDLRSALPLDFPRVELAVWLYRDTGSQSLLLAGRDEDRVLWLRYIPVQGLMQDRERHIRFSIAPWVSDLPLELWENLQMPAEERVRWLEAWHTETEWLAAVHAAKYSNAVISLYEQFSSSTRFSDQPERPLKDDELLLRFLERKRRLAQPDFIVFANDHWNFNYRGFNPGGNHGAFFRASTHATLMFAGGAATGIPAGLDIQQPYDVLSFVPTILSLTHQLTKDGLSSDLSGKGFQPFPGPVIHELFESSR